MKSILIVVIAYVLSLPELVVYTNDDYRFEVKLPQQFKTETLKQEEKFGSTEYIKLSGREGGAGYTVIATRYESNEAFKKNGIDFQEFIKNHSKHSNEEGFIRNNYVILAENHRPSILEYVVGDYSTEMTIIRRIYIKKGMTYSLSIYCNKEFLREENVEPFFKSFKTKL